MEKTPDSSNFRRIREALGSSAIGQAAAEVPDVYRTTNSMTAAITTAVISFYGQRRNEAIERLNE